MHMAKPKSPMSTIQTVSGSLLKNLAAVGNMQTFAAGFNHGYQIQQWIETRFTTTKVEIPITDRLSVQ